MRHGAKDLARGGPFHKSTKVLNCLRLRQGRSAGRISTPKHAGKLTVGKGGKLGERLHPSQVPRIFKEMACRAGLPPELVEGLSGHSTRVGAAQDMIASGIELPAIRMVTREPNRPVFVVCPGRWQNPAAFARGRQLCPSHSSECAEGGAVSRYAAWDND